MANLQSPMKEFEISIDDIGKHIYELSSSSRLAKVTLARQLSIYLLRHNLKMSLNEIGIHFGRRNHTTILHACRENSDK